MKKHIFTRGNNTAFIRVFRNGAVMQVFLDNISIGFVDAKSPIHCPFDADNVASEVRECLRLTDETILLSDAEAKAIDEAMKD